MCVWGEEYTHEHAYIKMNWCPNFVIIFALGLFILIFEPATFLRLPGKVQKKGIYRAGETWEKEL